MSTAAWIVLGCAALIGSVVAYLIGRDEINHAVDSTLGPAREDTPAAPDAVEAEPQRRNLPPLWQPMSHGRMGGVL